MLLSVDCAVFITSLENGGVELLNLDLIFLISYLRYCFIVEKINLFVVKNTSLPHIEQWKAAKKQEDIFRTAWFDRANTAFTLPTPYSINDSKNAIN